MQFLTSVHFGGAPSVSPDGARCVDGLTSTLNALGLVLPRDASWWLGEQATPVS